jgi:hypothetical protein
LVRGPQAIEICVQRDPLTIPLCESVTALGWSA